MFRFVLTKKYNTFNLDEHQAQFISSAEQINQFIKQKKFFAYDVFYNNDRVAFCILRKDSNDSVFLWDYIIDPNIQGRGFGQGILKELKLLLHNLHFKNLTTTYIVGNQIAKHVYEKVGFEEIEEVNIFDFCVNVDKIQNKKNILDFKLCKKFTPLNIDDDKLSERINYNLENFKNFNGYDIYLDNERVAFCALNKNKDSIVLSELLLKNKKMEKQILGEILQFAKNKKEKMLFTWCDAQDKNKIAKLKKLGFEVKRHINEIDMEVKL